MKSKIIIIPILKKTELCNTDAICNSTANLRFSQPPERGKGRNVI